MRVGRMSLGNGSEMGELGERSVGGYEPRRQQGMAPIGAASEFTASVLSFACHSFCHSVAKTPKNKKGQEQQAPDLRFRSGGPCGTRTHDLRIKSLTIQFKSWAITASSWGNAESPLFR